MDILFIHPNFPGQFLRIIQELSKNPEYNIYGLGDKNKYTKTYDNVELMLYDFSIENESLNTINRYVSPMHTAVQRAEIVATLLLEKKSKGFEPDIIFVHPGWGDGFFLKEIFPMTCIVGFMEYFYHPRGADVGFDPEFPMNIDDIFRLKILNSVHLLALESCDLHISPTKWQASRFPKVYQDKMQIIHEGIDTQYFKPNNEVVITLQDGTTLKKGDEILTYVSRDFEPYRGYHQFMRSLPEVLKERPNCHVIIVGNDGISYGRKLPEGQTYKEIYLDEVKDKLDLSRVHFTGKLSYDDYRKVLQISTTHLYLTYPFVLSWSMLEAMSCGCLVIGSKTAPVEEVITNNENGILTPFFKPEIIAKNIIKTLENPRKFDKIRDKAREYIKENFDLTNSIVKYKKIIEENTF